MGIAKGTAEFALSATPIPGAIQAMRDLRHPSATRARMQAEARATVNTIKSLGTAEGRQTVVSGIANTWNNASTTDKAAVITQVTLWRCNGGCRRLGDVRHRGPKAQREA